MPLSRSDIHAVLGEVDDQTAALIVSTGATFDELEEAYYEVERAAHQGESIRFSTEPRVQALRVLLEELPVWRDEEQGVYS